MDIETKLAVHHAFERTATVCDKISDSMTGYICEAMDETLRCRHCQEPVEFLAKFCSCCDQSYPARLSRKAWLLLFGFPTLLTFLYILFSS